MVSGYHSQPYHPGPLGSHDFYPGPHYPAATPGTGHYRVTDPTSGPAADTAYLQNWMIQNSQTPSEMGAMPPTESPYSFPGSTHAGLPPGMAGDYTNMAMLGLIDGATGQPIRIRGVKRRNTNNKKERRRTHSINSAFASLRGCIPNVPSDTKLSKIKTLRLATSYIAYLMDVLNKDDPKLTEGGFKAEIAKKIETREEKRRREAEVSKEFITLTLCCINNVRGIVRVWRSGVYT